MRSILFVPTMIVRLAGLALLMAATPAQPQASRSDQRDWIGAHNLAREDVGLAPLAWSDKLARDAEAWAHHLARNNLYEHASPQQRKGQGENLWRGDRDRHAPWEMIDLFVAEKRIFRPGVFPDVSRTGRWSDVGHYTQIIWPETQEVGCATALNDKHEVLVPAIRAFLDAHPLGSRVAPAIDPDPLDRTADA